MTPTLSAGIAPPHRLPLGLRAVEALPGVHCAPAGRGGGVVERASGDCWGLLKGDPEAVLVDVRTIAEWTYVGVPDLSVLPNRTIFQEWQSFPTMVQDAEFARTLDEKLGGAHDVTVVFLCRSGARSRAAAHVMSSLGYRHCVNVSDGFEGALNDQGQRGSVGGWKAAGLPWVQT